MQRVLIEQAPSPLASPASDCTDRMDDHPDVQRYYATFEDAPPRASPHASPQQTQILPTPTQILRDFEQRQGLPSVSYPALLKGKVVAFEEPVSPAPPARTGLSPFLGPSGDLRN